MESLINVYRDKNDLVNEAIERFVVEINRFRVKGEKKFLLTGCGKKSGTTSTAISLAIELSLCGQRTLLIDCDFRKGNRCTRLSEKTQSGLADYLDVNKQQIKQEHIIYKTNYELLEYIPSGNSTDIPVHLLCSQRMEELIRSLEQDYEYIIFDCPSINIVSDACIFFPLIDRVLLVTRLEHSTKRQLYTAKATIKKYKSINYGIIVNGVNMREYRRNIKDYAYLRTSSILKRHKEIMKRKDQKIVKG